MEAQRKQPGGQPSRQTASRAGGGPPPSLPQPGPALRSPCACTPLVSAPPGCRPRVSATETACVPHRPEGGQARNSHECPGSPFHPGRVTPWRAPSAGQATLNAARQHWIWKWGWYGGSLTKSYVLAEKRECRGGQCSSYHSEGPRAELRPRSAGQRRQGGGLTSSLPQSGGRAEACIQVSSLVTLKTEKPPMGKETSSP